MEDPIVFVPVISDTDMQLVAPDGTMTVRLSAGEEKAIHPHLLEQALRSGVRAVKGHNSQMMPEEEIIEALVDAMVDILADGKAEQVTKSGEPRYATLKARCPEFTREQQETAWEIVLNSGVSEIDDAESEDD